MISRFIRKTSDGIAIALPTWLWAWDGMFAVFHPSGVDAFRWHIGVLWIKPRAPAGDRVRLLYLPEHVVQGWGKQ